MRVSIMRTSEVSVRRNSGTAMLGSTKRLARGCAFSRSRRSGSQSHHDPKQSNHFSSSYPISTSSIFIFALIQTWQNGHRRAHCLDESCSQDHSHCKPQRDPDQFHHSGPRPLTNNAISIKELEFLTDSSVISPQQLSSILSQLPAQTQLHAPLQAGALASGATTTPVETFGALNVKDHYTTIPSPAPLPPPAYASGPQVLSIASALYAYSPTDAGDLALQQNDRIQVTEHMNNDCENCQCLLQTNC